MTCFHKKIIPQKGNNERHKIPWSLKSIGMNKICRGGRLGGGRDTIYNVIIDDGVAPEINSVLFNSSLLNPFETVWKVVEHNNVFISPAVCGAGILSSVCSYVGGGSTDPT